MTCQRLRRLVVFGGSAVLVPLLASTPAPADEGPLAIVRQRCFDCHADGEVQGGIDLAALTAAADVSRDFGVWQKVREVVEAGRMPPREAEPLAAGEREVLCGWIAPRLRLAIEAHAGDPGLVTLRRLTNAEYDATVRDLTGIDFGLAREFEPDGGGGEGFSNTGDVLFVSPRQFDRYLAAGRSLADHASILPGTGIVFHEQRVGLRGPEQLRDQARQAIYVWYQKAAMPHVPLDGDDLREAEYLLACWKHRHRDLTGVPSLDALADAAGLSRAYLANWWAFLEADAPASRYLDLTRLAWRALPPPDPTAPQAVPEGVIAGTKAIDAERKSWYTRMPERYGETTQRAQQDIEALYPYPLFALVEGRPHVHLLAGDAADGPEGDVVRLFDFTVWVADKPHGYHDWLVARRQELEQAVAARPVGPAPDAAMARDLDAVRTVLDRFGKHPRGRTADARELVLVAPEKITLPLPAGATKFRAQGRLDLEDPDIAKATAQWMATTDDALGSTGVFADAFTVWQRGSPKGKKAMHEFGLMRLAFPATRDLRLAGITENLHGPNKHPWVYWLSDEQLLALLPAAEGGRHAALMTDWNTTRHLTTWPELATDWDQRLLAHLDAFAVRAWRGPLADDERARLHAIYKTGLEAATAAGTEGGREQAAREALVAVLSAPRFLFRVEEQRPGEQRVSAHELAARVSYFLWSSLPDDQLRQAAADGSLLEPERLTAEVKRMLADPKAEALAREFAAQWLRFRGFSTKAPPDRETFPELTPELQADMEREAVAFLADLIRTDRPLRELFTAGHTFLNERLAVHYRVPGVVGPEFRRVDVAAHGRGGLLGMGAVLASTSYPRRTSPVLRGNWVLSAVLGTPTPPPPPNIPPLDESPAAGLGLRARLQAHRANAACAVCHDRIDPLGFALEGFDALGRRRDLDDAGAPVDLVATLADGTTFTGFDGLRDHLARHRDVVTLQLCRKLLGYALGREILPTDLPLLEDLCGRILGDDAGISAAVLGIVHSRQFQNRRDDPDPGT
jgi:hypothetical protein